MFGTVSPLDCFLRNNRNKDHVERGYMDQFNQETVVVVDKKSEVSQVAGEIAQAIRSSKKASIQTDDKNILWIAVKAVAVARAFLALEGIDLICLFSYEEYREIIRIDIEPREP